MPPFALVNNFWLGRWHPLYRGLGMGNRMLLSRGRLLLQQLFLGRGPADEVQKGMTGNSMLIAQAQAVPDQVFPSVACGYVLTACGSVHAFDRVSHRLRACLASWEANHNVGIGPRDSVFGLSGIRDIGTVTLRVRSASSW